MVKGSTVIILAGLMLVSMLASTSALSCAACEELDILQCPQLYCGLRGEVRGTCACCNRCGQLPGEKCSAFQPCRPGDRCDYGTGSPFFFLFFDVTKEGVCV